MAADIKKILADLFEFYDFNSKTLISVGAGGGQFIEYVLWLCPSVIPFLMICSLEV